MNFKYLIADNCKISLSYCGKSYELLYDLFPDIEKALDKLGFGKEAKFCVISFIGETISNAIKARGSKIITDKYGSFEDLFGSDDNAKEIINTAIADNYQDSVIKFKWELTPGKLLIKVTNNSSLNTYLENRIIESMERKEISLSLLDNISSDDNLHSTKATGMGMGLWIALQEAKKINGKISYKKKKNSTVFLLEILR